MDTDNQDPDIPTEDHIEGELELAYPTLEAWVENWLSYIYDQSITSASAWCSRWWDHFGAYVRLHSMWETWETARKVPGQMAHWFLQIGDPMMKELTRADGVFYGCKDRSIGEYASRWVVEGPPLKQVKQQAPTITHDETGKVTVIVPDIEGVQYVQELNDIGQTVISAVPKPGYQLHTGHREERPHPNGQLPTEKQPLMEPMP